MPEEEADMPQRATNATIQAEIRGLRERLDLVWSNHEREHEQHEAAHGREHEFTQRAIDTAAILQKETKTDANEWRETMNDRERTFATKTDIATIAGTLEELKKADIKRTETERLEKEQAARDRVTLTERMTTEREEQNERIRGNQWRVGLIVGVAATVGSILINLALRLSTT